MRKIKIITPYFYPENTAATNRIVSITKVLSTKYEITVISLTEKGKRQVPKFAFFNKNIPVFYVNQKKYNDRHFLTRAIYELFYSIKLTLFARKIKADFTIVTSPYMFLIPTTIILGDKSKKILDLRDLVWLYLDNSTFIKKIIKSFLTLIAKSYLERYIYIIVTNNTEKTWLFENIKNKRIEIIHNGIIKEKFDNLSNITISRQKEKLTISYIGNVGIAQNLLVLIRTAQDLNFLTVNIIGDGNDINNLKAFSDANNITNVHFRGKLSFNELKKYYYTSHILYAQLDEKYFPALPSKLIEYLSTGLPIVYGGKGEAVDFAKKFENVFIIPPNNEKELTNILKELSREKLHISFKNRKLIENNYIRERINLKYLWIIDNLL